MPAVAHQAPQKSLFGLAGFADWLPFLGLPAVVILLGVPGPRWALMWGLAASVYAGLKWLSFSASDDAGQAPLGRKLAYLLLWPGMDPAVFFAPRSQGKRFPFSRWLAAVAVTAAGLLLFFGAGFSARFLPSLIAGWTCMGGVMLFFLFGVPQLAALGWQSVGVKVRPIMKAPYAAASMSDFWGRRWNLAFRDVMHRAVFQPLLRYSGVGPASFAVFAISGLMHDLVMSLPARGGYGLPTLYFLLQWLGLVVERSDWGRGLGLGKGMRGRIFAAFMILSPLPLLFHLPFVERALLPTLDALRVF